MKNIAKRALGLTSALFFVGAMALVASPVQAADVDTRINALERELALLKQSQEVASEERALAAEMKGPKFSYKAGKGLTISAADNNWSIKFGQRLQVYSTFYMTQDNTTKTCGKKKEDPCNLQHGQLRVRRFRPSINVTSQQGFYAVNWQFSGKSTVAFNGDGYLNFNKINPFMPSLGWGYNPSFSGISKGLFSAEDAIFSDALAMGGAQDGSIVLSWKGLPAMGLAKISHLNFALGHDELDEYGSAPPATDNSRSFAASIGIKPLGAAKAMGGLDMSSLTYKFAYESLRNGYSEGVGTLGTVHRTKQIMLADIGTVTGDHVYYGHSLEWSPLKFLNLTTHHVSWNGDAEAGAKAVKYKEAVATASLDTNDGDGNPLEDMTKAKPVLPSAVVRGVAASTADMQDRSVKEHGIGLRMWLWGPKSGALGGSPSEGGISIAPVYTVVDIKERGAMPMPQMVTDTNGDMAPATDEQTGVAHDHDNDSDTDAIATPDVHVREMGGEVKNMSLIIDFYVPGGWLKLSGIWDNYSCDASVCHGDVGAASDGKDNFSTFTLAAEYRF